MPRAILRGKPCSVSVGEMCVMTVSVIAICSRLN